MNRPVGEFIPPHYHNINERSVQLTQEVLVIRKGRLRVDFYSPEQSYIGSEELGAGDVLMLAAGGDAFKMIEPVEMIEIKQGPYAGLNDKTIFNGIPEEGVYPCPLMTALSKPNRKSRHDPRQHTIARWPRAEYLLECIEGGWISSEGPFESF